MGQTPMKNSKKLGANGVRTFAQGSQVLSLSLDKYSGSGFRSEKQYLFGRFDMQLRLVLGDFAGTITTFYVSLLVTFMLIYTLYF